MHSIKGVVLALGLVGMFGAALTPFALAQNMSMDQSITARGKRGALAPGVPRKILLNAGGNITLNVGGVMLCNAC